MSKAHFDMRFRILALLAVMLLVAGCGTSKKTTRSINGRTQSEQVVIRRNRPPNVDQTVRRNLEEKEITPPRTCPILNFSGAECEHVRLLEVNQLPAGGLIISLDELNNDFCYPLKGKFISDYGMRSGRMHTGIDIKAVLHDTIRAAFSGVARMSKSYNSYGNVVVIRHYSGFESVYSHNSKNLVKVNDQVYAGQPIALAGRTGRATTEHLHFEVRVSGEHIDPKLMLDPDKMSLRRGWLFISNNDGIVSAANSERGLTLAEEDARANITATEVARAQALAESTINGKPKSPSEPEPIYHRVQKRETLSHIAGKYKTTVKQICNLNNISSTAILQINQRLRVK